MRLFQPRGVAVPIDIPQGGVALALPIDGHELKKLAKKIVSLEYLQDGKGKYVFNPEGKPVPRFEQNDEALIDEAMRRVPKIKNVEIPVYLHGDDGEFVLQRHPGGTSSENAPRTVVVDVDDSDALVTAGDFSDTKKNIKRAILSEIIEVELPLPADAEKKGDDASESATPKPRTRKVEQLVAEFLIEQCANLGRAKREAEQKN